VGLTSLARLTAALSHRSRTKTPPLVLRRQLGLMTVKYAKKSKHSNTADVPAKVSEEQTWKRLRIKSPAESGPPPPALTESSTADSSVGSSVTSAETQVIEALPDEAQLKALVQEVRGGCEAVLKTGLDGTIALPADAARQLAAAVRVTKLAVFGAQTAGDAKALLETHSASVSSFSELCPTLVTLFGALSTLDGASPDLGAGVEDGSRSDVEVGLHLAAAYFDSIAAVGSSVGDGDGDVGRAILKFLASYVRATYGHGSKTKSREHLQSGSSIEEPLAAVFRSLHHALAAVKFAPIPAAHRAVPVLARCLAVGITTAPRPLPSSLVAAADLMQGILGQGEEQMQAHAIEELVSVAASSHVQQLPRKGRGAVGPTIHTVALLRAVCAACLPVRIGATHLRSQSNGPDGAGTGEANAATVAAAKPVAREQQPVAEALARWRSAEARAGELAAGVVRKCLLAVRDKETDPEPWARLEALVREVLDLSANPTWVSAPTLLLCLAKALSRVAGAGRGVDLAWTQREFAVRLLGQVAEFLCREDMMVSKTSDQDLAEDFSKLRKWSAEVSSSKAKLEQGSAEEFLQLLTAYLRAAPDATPDLMFPCRASQTQRQLDSTALPGAHPIFACSFLLCSHVAQSAADSGAEGASKKCRHGKASKQHGKATTTKAKAGKYSAEDEAREWLALTQHLDARAKGAKAIRQRDGLLQCVARIRRKFLHQNGVGALSRARMVALETLQAQLRSSPLAFVRRQATAGLSAACAADARLVGSRSIGQAIVVGLQDDSPCVRVSSVDLLGRLLGDESKGLAAAHVAECRAAVSARLDDSSSAVRRAAFRVTCSTLRSDSVGLASIAADLLRRIRYETTQVRETVLGALERVLLKPPLSEATSQHLVDIVGHKDVGGAGIQEVFKMHQSLRSSSIFVTSMESLTVMAFGCIVENSASTDVSPWALILEQVALVYPLAIHKHTPQLVAWLKLDPNMSRNKIILAQHSCRILSDALPSWAAKAEAEHRTRIGVELRKLLGALLSDQGSRLTRNAAECLCMVAAHLTSEAAHDIAKHLALSLQHVQDCVKAGASLDALAQRCLCRHAWTLGTFLEHIEVDAIAAVLQDKDKSAFKEGELASSANQLFVKLCLRGPPSLRPSIIPCLGFLLRRHCQYLRSSLSGDATALDVFRAGLAGREGGEVLQAQSAEVLASLLASYEQAAEAEAPLSSGGDWGATVAASVQKPKISEAVQRLAGLQPQVLALLRVTKSQQTAGHMLCTLSSLSRLGVLHPSSAMPDLLAASVAGFPELVGDVQRLLVRLTEFAPQLLPSRLGAGLQLAAKKLAASQVELGSLAGAKWRFTVLCEMYTMHTETRRNGDRFVEILLAEFETLTQLASPRGEAEVAARDIGGCMLRAELVFALLVALPYRSELEVARVVVGASRFLALRAVPLLLPDPSTVGELKSDDVFGVCVVASLLHVLSQHLCSGTGGSACLQQGSPQQMEEPLRTGSCLQASRVGLCLASYRCLRSCVRLPRMLTPCSVS